MFWKRCSSDLAPALIIAALVAGMPRADATDDGLVPAGGEFTLASTLGPVSLGDLRDKVVMLFFGYTSCPDVCPLSLAKIGACLSSLEPEQVEDVGALFITLDPGRDTAKRMQQYAGFFHSSIIGLTGTREEIDEVTTRYGVAYERKSLPDSALGYGISHPDTILLLDRDGALAGQVGHREGGETLRKKVLELLARG